MIGGVVQEDGASGGGVALATPPPVPRPVSPDDQSDPTTNPLSGLPGQAFRTQMPAADGLSRNPRLT
jgi:hypothetical protein